MVAARGAWLRQQRSRADRGGRAHVAAYVGLGGNEGGGGATMAWAVQQLRALAACTRSQVWGLYGSAPWQAQGPDYFNAVLALDVTLTAPALWQTLVGLEQVAGRQRPIGTRHVAWTWICFFMVRPACKARR